MNRWGTFRDGPQSITQAPRRIYGLKLVQETKMSKGIPKPKLVAKGKRGSWFVALYTQGGKLVDSGIPVAYKFWFRGTWRPCPKNHADGIQTDKDFHWVEMAKKKGRVALVQNDSTSEVSPKIGSKIGVFKIKNVSITSNTFDLELDPDRESDLE